MAYCDKCGVQVANDVRFCPVCGFRLMEACEDSDNAKDTTTSCDVESNKAMAVLSYLGILVLVPLLGAKNSPFARFHTNQGLILCIATILYSVAMTSNIHINFIKRLRRGGVSYANQSIYTPQPITGLLLRGSR